jgi:hypothetical protein
MRGFVFIVLLTAALLGGCKDKADTVAVVAQIPAGYNVSETKTLKTLADCETRVRDMTKGGDVSAQAAGDGIIIYEFMLNSGRMIWQSCSVQSNGKYAHVVAFSEEPSK